MPKHGYYLGVDGGQSHTTALVADGSGRVLGSGHAGPSNHTLAPGGRTRLERALQQSVAGALAAAGLAPSRAAVRRFTFLSAHLAMTGEPQDKVETVQDNITAGCLVVGHDAPGALAGATGGRDGIIVLAGTGSVAFGRFRGRSFRIGGRGYIFADQGSAWAIARDAISQTLMLQERGSPPPALRSELLRYFGRKSVEDIIEDFYRRRISRERIASFSRQVGRLAGTGDRECARLLRSAARTLAEMAAATAFRLRTGNAAISVSYGGGVFRDDAVRHAFGCGVRRLLPPAMVSPPRFGPDVGALLLAYRQAGLRLGPSVTARIEESYIQWKNR